MLYVQLPELGRNREIFLEQRARKHHEYNIASPYYSTQVTDAKTYGLHGMREKVEKATAALSSEITAKDPNQAEK